MTPPQSQTRPIAESSWPTVSILLVESSRRPLWVDLSRKLQSNKPPLTASAPEQGFERLDHPESGHRADRIERKYEALKVWKLALSQGQLLAQMRL
jgi:hypothetical protein